MLLSPENLLSRYGLGRDSGIDRREKAGQNSGSKESSESKPVSGGGAVCVLGGLAGDDVLLEN